MKLFWRTYCMNCDLWLRGDWWLLRIHDYRLVCPRCQTIHEKGDLLDEDGWRHYIKVIHLEDRVIV